LQELRETKSKEGDDVLKLWASNLARERRKNNPFIPSEKREKKNNK